MGTAVMEYTSYVLAFLGTATLNLLAPERVPTPTCTREERKAWDETLRGVLVIAALIGCVHAAATLFGALPLGAAVGAQPEFAGRTALYLRCRAPGCLAHHLTQVLCAASFAARDSTLPLLTTLVVAGVNAAGDVLLCPQLGIGGAAVATSAAQFAALAFIAARLHARSLLPAVRRASAQAGAAAAAAGSGARSWLDGLKPYLPSPRQLSRIAAVASPVMCAVVCRVALYALLARWACACGMLSAAAHQITSTVFWGSSSATAEPMSAAAQTYVPELTARYVRARGAEGLGGAARRAACVAALRATFNRLLVVTVPLGLLSATAVHLLCRPGPLSVLAPSAEVIALVPHAPLVVTSALIAPMLLCEGMLMALGGYTALSGAMLFSTGTAVALALALVRSGRGSVASLWWVATYFTAMRLVSNAGCLVWRRMADDGKPEDDEDDGTP